MAGLTNETGADNIRSAYIAHRDIANRRKPIRSQTETHMKYEE